LRGDFDTCAIPNEKSGIKEISLFPIPLLFDILKLGVNQKYS
jgi:hypothetical protein